MFCVHCCTRLPEEARFCSRCGKPTDNLVAPSPTASSSPTSGVLRSNVVEVPRTDATDPPSHISDSSNAIRKSNSVNPWLAAVLSLVIAGLGQLILGQVGKGIVVLIVSFVLAIVTGGLSALVMWPAMAIDAYMIAKKLRAGRVVGQWELF